MDLAYGYVTGTFVRTVGDDGAQATIPQSGKVAFAPVRELRPFENPPVIVADAEQTFNIDPTDGVVKDDGELVRLVVGQYLVTPRITGVVLPKRFQFVVSVTAEHTESDPLVLSEHMELVDGPDIEYVANYEILHASEAARDAAALSASAAEQSKNTAILAAEGAASEADDAHESAGFAEASANEAAAAADDAEQYATAAAQSASAASDSAIIAGDSAVTAVGARDAAAGSATAAAGSATTAGTAAGAANAAATDAVTARNAAQSAKTDAEAARTAAQSAKTDAEAAKTAAEAARDVSLAGQFVGSLASGTPNFDTFSTPGVYRFPSSVASVATNAPTGVGGILRVYSLNGVTLQEYIPVGSPSGFYLRGSNTVNQPWRFVPTLTSTSGGELALRDPVAGADVGIFSSGRSFSSGSLDAITSPGVWFNTTTTIATLANNWPIAGVLATVEVQQASSSLPSAGGNVIQIVRPYGGAQLLRGEYKRYRASGTWSAWRFTPMSRVENPGDQPGVIMNLWDDANNRELAMLSFHGELGTVDLNLITVHGSYSQQNSANGTLARNYPIANSGGVLEVVRLSASNGGRVLQRFTVQSGHNGFTRGFYERRMYDGVWAPWYFTPSQRVDQTAGRAIYTWDDVNTREQLVWGDTGWRNLSALQLNGWTGGTIYLRRVGSQVSMRFTNVNGSAKTADDFIFMDPGFRPLATTRLPFAASSTLVSILEFGPTTNCWRSASTNSLGSNFTEITWQTTEAWPTALPGTAVGGIPSV